VGHEKKYLPINSKIFYDISIRWKVRQFLLHLLVVKLTAINRKKQSCKKPGGKNPNTAF